MTDTVVPATPVGASPTAKKAAPIKKKPTGGAVVKGAKAAATHPTTSVMVTSAIKELKEKKGSSLPAIKKYLAANYKVDPVKLAPFIRKFLKAAVANKTIVQTKGTGASGHFKLAVAEAKPKKKVIVKKKAPVVKKAKSPGTPKAKKPAAKKLKSSASVEPAVKKGKKAAAPKATKSKSPAKPKKPAALKSKVAKSPKKAIKKVVALKKK